MPKDETDQILDENDAARACSPEFYAQLQVDSALSYVGYLLCVDAAPEAIKAAQDAYDAATAKFGEMVRARIAARINR